MKMQLCTRYRSLLRRDTLAELTVKYALTNMQETEPSIALVRLTKNSIDQVWFHGRFNFLPLERKCISVRRLIVQSSPLQGEAAKNENFVTANGKGGANTNGIFVLVPIFTFVDSWPKLWATQNIDISPCSHFEHARHEPVNI